MRTTPAMATSIWSHANRETMSSTIAWSASIRAFASAGFIRSALAMRSCIHEPIHLWDPCNRTTLLRFTLGMRYLFVDDQRARLEAAEDLMDDGTIRILERLGTRPGWRCLEVGAG